MEFSFKEIATIAMILFVVIDVIGSLPILLDLQSKHGKIHAEKATLISGAIMIVFMFVGEQILNLIGIDVSSFAIAGSFIIFFLAMEMILGITLIKDDPDAKGSGSIVPLAFPLIAGAGTLTTILSLRAVYQETNVLIGILLNLVFVYIVLRSASWLERVVGKSGFAVLRRVFGMILLAISVKIFKGNLLPS